MNLHKPILVAAAVLAIALVANIIMASPTASAPKQDVSAWTKAICTEDNYCIDVRITCVDGKVTEIKPMGSGVQFSGAWKDRRPDELKDGICI